MWENAGWVQANGWYRNKVSGGAPAGTIFTPSVALSGDDNNTGTHFRVICTLTAASNGKIKVTFTAASNAGLAVTLAYAGKASGVTIGATTAAPLQLLFSGSPSFSIAAGASITSDLLDHSASFPLAIADAVVVNHDEGTPGGERFSSANTNVSTWFTVSSGSFTPASTQTPNTSDGWTQLAGTDYAVAKIETV